MANIKISELPQISFSSITNNDVIPIVDVDSNTTSKVLMSDLKTYFDTPFTGGTIGGLTADTLSATTISGGTLYGDGSNLTNLPSEWTKIVVDITNPITIQNIGSSPIEILPAPGVGKYYEYEGIVEYTHVTADYNFVDVVGIIGESSYAGTYIIFSTPPFATDKIVQFSSKSPTYTDSIITDTLVSAGFNLNEKIVLTTYNGNDATLGDGTFKIKLKYKIIDFG
jgi:hypothetical protein